MFINYRRTGEKMNYKEFIKTEAKALLQSGLSKEVIFELLENGLAEELRFFAEINHYNITETDLQKLIILKFYKRYYQT